MSLDLPAALRPWREGLALFPPELAAAVGALVARLAVIVGPLERSAASPTGELDGVSGIARRGPLHRLLPTSWALLDAWPDEFLRRAATGELAFIEMARREPHDDRRSVALFDAGVTQLGGPRVVHVALLVLLHARARDGGASFAWGFTQDPSCSLVEGLSRGSVLRLVERRYDRRASEADRGRWQRALESSSAKKAALELWSVGDPRAAFASAGGARVGAIGVDDLLDPSRAAWVRVDVRAPGRPARSVELPLPEVASSVRLLRDPFGTVTPRRRVAPAVSSRLVFGAGGRHLYARSRRGLVVFPVPNSPKAPRIEPIVWSPPTGHSIVAVGHERRRRGRTIVLARAGDELWLHELARAHRSAYASTRLRIETSEEPALPGELAGLCRATDWTIHFIDAHRQLLCIDAGAVRDGPPWRALALRDADQVEALTEGPDVSVMVRGVSGWSSKARSRPIRASDATAEGRFGWGAVVAVGAGEGVWRARFADGPERLIPGPEQLVAGVLLDDRGLNDPVQVEPVLAVVNRADQCIDLLRPGGARTRSLVVGAPIDRAIVSEHGATIAVVSGATLRILDLQGRLCAQFALEEEGP